ncbi:hypothetical protein Pdw03_4521 [Penicillium digitatum]|uniref:Uncharacterized protein n=1 Tax=Penicillium digitatum TaxID=36651 RepID=A0A7T6XIF5_PENDI|nr:hypothetical protein Pdw03_4521 [Penicillium digitatum]
MIVSLIFYGMSFPVFQGSLKDNFSPISPNFSLDKPAYLHPIIKWPRRLSGARLRKVLAGLEIVLPVPDLCLSIAAEGREKSAFGTTIRS